MLNSGICSQIGVLPEGRPTEMRGWISASFLQKSTPPAVPSTFKVYVAAITPHHNAVDGKSLGKHNLIIGFLKRRQEVKSSK